MPNGVSGDWETMLSRTYIFLTIGRQLAKAATTAADHLPDGTPEERSQIAQHVAAIYRILRAVTVRRGGLANSPCWGWDRPLPTTARPSVWSDFKTGPASSGTPFVGTATPESRGAGTGDVPYQGPGSDRVRDRYANTSAALVMWITASAHITMWIAMSYRPHLHGL